MFELGVFLIGVAFLYGVVNFVNWYDSEMEDEEEE